MNGTFQANLLNTFSSKSLPNVLNPSKSLPRLWKCATATTVPHFEKAMLESKGFSMECHTYLSKIPPLCWSRSHFSGRCKSDVLINNICEVFNRWLVDERDKPIVACLEYIRKYLMQRIVTVIEKSANTDGPFTPGGKKMFDLVRKEAHKLQVLWSGNEIYQVNGFSGEQYVVNLERRTCSCRRWEITRMPCKHPVAAIWNMIDNSGKFGVPED
ncbi:uncharacterized protein [Rutidosis leptorrhynchoides]|uniref:uncharacterized protein n=1 Tax=Rutidosis leptorrhynchoides TaxID=125765 RepID=UPI003A99C8C7